MIAQRAARRLRMPIQATNAVVSSVSGQQIRPVGQINCELSLHSDSILDMVLLVLPKLPGDADLLIGMDAVKRVGGATLIVKPDGSVGAHFGSSKSVSVAAAVTESVRVDLHDVDFDAHFDGQQWEVAWKWSKGASPKLLNQVPEYAIKGHIREKYDSEVAKWISNGWLVPCAKPAGGIIPMMAVHHEHKDKVRPVLDYRELNQFVHSHTADSDVCPDTLRKRRLMGDRLGVVDLKDAYLQLHVKRELQEFQVVCISGQYYRLTRVGFGLTSAPKIMSAIVRHILMADPEIATATDHYVDDIVVDVDQVSVQRVIDHLRKFGLVTKPPERLSEASVLGLKLQDSGNGHLEWVRRKDLPDVTDQTVTRKELFSICGRLVAHYPIAGWLRVACSYMKRHAAGQRWEDPVGEQVMAWLRLVLQRVRDADPVRGRWAVSPVSHGRVWCDASGLATGVAVEIGGTIVEDAAWLRKPHDAAHINVAELDAVVQGLNMAIRWKLQTVCIATDSATVCGWLKSILAETHRVRTHGLAEMLIKRRLSMISELIAAYELNVTYELVPSARNKADALTRVPQAWLSATKMAGTTCAAMTVEQLHAQHHFGVDRTLHLARQVDSSVTRRQVENVVKRCVQCSSIDPTPVRWNSGRLSVERCWDRIAIDSTHVGHDKYLSIIDCGPSRYTIWRRIHAEDAALVTSVLEAVFIEFGPPGQILLDNSTTFRSDNLRRMCDKWNVQLRFRCAYRPSGNGIVERVHRTIKRIAARSKISVREAAFWYNIAPLTRDPASAPSTILFSSGYQWRNPNVQPAQLSSPPARYRVGDEVFVKPPAARCSTRWPKGRVTAILSDTNVEIDGVPRHVADCRPVPDVPTVRDISSDDSSDDDEVARDDESDDEDDNGNVWQNRLRQNRQPPNRFIDEQTLCAVDPLGGSIGLSDTNWL